ncbi:hypothetical protein [Lutibacter sp.]|uniref:hypothetical protein n=1 Tax=Lutibacter sp. TaxID=1925666 RepID=UPI0034A03466
MKRLKISTVLFGAFIFMAFTPLSCEKVTLYKCEGEERVSVQVYEFQVDGYLNNGYNVDRQICNIPPPPPCTPNCEDGF